MCVLIFLEMGINYLKSDKLKYVIILVCCFCQCNPRSVLYFYMILKLVNSSIYLTV